MKNNGRIVQWHDNPHGFLFQHDSQNSDDPFFLSANAAGFGQLSPKSTKVAESYHQWIGGEHLLTWNESGDLFYRGKEITGVNSLLACAINLAGELVVLASIYIPSEEHLKYAYRLEFYTLSGSTATKVSETVLVSNVYESPLDTVTTLEGTACFNHDGTKLVFIAPTHDTKVMPLPFDPATLGYMEGSQPIIGTIASSANSQFPSINHFGTTYIQLNEAAMSDLQGNWQYVYRYDINTTDRVATQTSATLQFARHVYKFIETETRSYTRTESSTIPPAPTAPPDPANPDSGYGTVSVVNASYSLSSVRTIDRVVTAVALYKADYVTNIWFDAQGVEHTEICSSDVKYDYSQTTADTYTNEWTQAQHYVWADLGIEIGNNEWSLDLADVDNAVYKIEERIISRTDAVDYGFCHRVVSSYGVAKETSFHHEIGSGNRRNFHDRYMGQTGTTSFIHNTLPNIQQSSESGSSTGKLGGLELDSNEGFNRYIPNFYTFVRYLGNTDELYQPYPNYVAGDPLHIYSSQFTAIEEAHAVVKGVDATDGYHALSHQTVGALHTQPRFNGVGAFALLPSPYLNDYVIPKTFSYPSNPPPDLYDSYQTPPSTGVFVTESLLIFDGAKLSTSNSHNYGVRQLIDGYGNMALGAWNNIPNVTQETVKVFNKNFAATSDDIQTAVSAVATNLYGIVGVI